MNNQTIVKTNFEFPNQTHVYKGKVRDVYKIGSNHLVMIATDRISAFDTVLPVGIPYKGQVLNQIATHFLDLTSSIIDNWKLSSPDPVVTIGQYCTPFKVEMVIRGYLTGHAWREYKSGKRVLCGQSMPDGMKEHDKFPEPLVTPTTKADHGHDEDISKKEIIETGLVAESDYLYLEQKTKELFSHGTEFAKNKGLILVDTKYEFGKNQDGKIVLIDEIHTPDSSRYFYLEGYDERQSTGANQKQLSKEFVREWLIANNFQGKEGQVIPNLDTDFINSVSDRYIELYNNITGESFSKADNSNIIDRINKNVNGYLSNLA
ncbi:MAG: phosphoribosylaminoimidazolesuccinocarboxamide synthase [Flavobacteriales bacterium]|jgi:phosphoribosylaminoimidazole-succinocarboxamide synthase|nr:phosphoribosylaminoimidazolesuccinocarboxamide synthase [Flavobacteriales bacterium]|tara:strand:- start:8891 stop:9847 length:957 start_codon:yes stop_codon:yes gene_type:complete